MFYSLARPCALALVVCVLLGAAPPPVKKGDAGPDLVERLKVMEARLRAAEAEAAVTRDRLRLAEKQRRDLMAELARKEAAIKKLSGGSGRWVQVRSWAVSCCGCWYPVTWWYYVPAPALEAGGGAIERVRASASIGRRKALPERLDISLLKKGDATTVFWKGYEAFHDGEYASAWKSFEAATRLSDGDARFWYYRALAERALGDKKAAEASRQAGIKAEKKREVKADELAFALERIQGARRVWLRLGD